MWTACSEGIVWFGTLFPGRGSQSERRTFAAHSASPGSFDQEPVASVCR
jgi:hypothetical protein